MKSVSISDAKNNLSALLREIRGGATITITDRGVVVAQLTPPPSSRGIPASAVDLAQQGLLVLPGHEPRADWDRDLPRAKLKKGTSAVAALLAERESGW